MQKTKFVKLMQQEMVVALGCTDPVSISYVSAIANKYAGGKELKRITVSLSLAVLKNATSVIIPGTTKCGIAMAAALGVVCGDPEKQLQVLENLESKDVDNAEKIINAGMINVKQTDNNAILYVEVEVETDSGTAKAIVKDDYNNLVYVEKNGEIIIDKMKSVEQDNEEHIENKYDLNDIWEFIKTADVETDLVHVKKTIELNSEIARVGLENEVGLQVGKTLMENMEKGIKEKNMANMAICYASAGADARMSGSPTSVMSNSGSGNQGITATMSVVAAAKYLGVNKETQIRAVALSNLVSIYIKRYVGRVSVICGATTAAMGASAGMVYLLGGNKQQVEYTIKNMLGNITGMLCDGAKTGCALKVATALQAAEQSAYLAMKDIAIQPTDGVIGKSLEKSLENLEKISKDIYMIVNQSITDIMFEKEMSI
ncbi:L-cysteine desulfidase family protein [Vallitalea maricola]|uniref:L-serine ammonia-lyase, iron-sulfur-dependent, subunit alpha n=1 Tax=Vallitalea maricola TaxID=3074433 RepID=A0ACB5UMB4_9FIRM|nr:L-serine ammonia-lyase, iron-sulfur-dependent, subunit alpha [Vallitalea sp. AN17-2]